MRSVWNEGSQRQVPKLRGMDVPRTRRRSLRPVLVASAAVPLLVIATLALSSLSGSAPSVDRASVWIDEVRRGDLLRQVSAPGTLVPEEIRWLTAETAGRVEELPFEAGTRVDADALLVSLSNPDLEIRYLEAARELRTAEADHLNLQATLEIERLRQRAVVADLEVEQREAARRAEAAELLADADVMAERELIRIRERAEGLAYRLRTAEEHARVLEQSLSARLAASEANLERLSALVRFSEEQLESLQVRAGMDGVLRETPLEVGQRVRAGDLLAKVIRPERLKAELRVPEARAKEVVVGQRASIDTHNGVASARVNRIDPAVQDGTVTVDVVFTEALPPGARPDLSVDGSIELERLQDVLYTGRPAFAAENGRITLFRVQAGGSSVAERVPVKLGGGSASEIQILEGLEEGDRVILSDMSRWDDVDRIAFD